MSLDPDELNTSCDRTPQSQRVQIQYFRATFDAYERSQNHNHGSLTYEARFVGVAGVAWFTPGVSFADIQAEVPLPDEVVQAGSQVIVGDFAGAQSGSAFVLGWNLVRYFAAAQSVNGGPWRPLGQDFAFPIGTSAALILPSRVYSFPEAIPQDSRFGLGVEWNLRPWGAIVTGNPVPWSWSPCGVTSLTNPTRTITVSNQWTDTRPVTEQSSTLESVWPSNPNPVWTAERRITMQYLNGGPFRTSTFNGVGDITNPCDSLTGSVLASRTRGESPVDPSVVAFMESDPLRRCRGCGQ